MHPPRCIGTPIKDLLSIRVFKDHQIDNIVVPRLCKHLDLRVAGVPAKILHVRKIKTVHPLVGEIGVVLQEGMTLAIEPMSTLGKKEVYLEDNDWTVTTQDGLASAHYENTVLITKDGVEILTL